MNELKEECGLFGIWSEKPSDLARTCYYALYALQHRGQEGAGIAVAADDGIVSRKDAGLVNDVFTSSVLSSFPETTMAISHVRYGTTGINPRLNVQPLVVNHYLGSMAVAHNGNLANDAELRKELELNGSIFHTTSDTEVIAYILDYLTRKQGLTMKESSEVIAAPFWTTIASKDEEERKRLSYLRKMFSSFLITGPFSILVGFRGGMMALNDRLKLRSLVAAEKGRTVYFSSEEAAIRCIEPEPDRIWAPRGGEAVIVTLDGRKDGQTI